MQAEVLVFQRMVVLELWKKQVQHLKQLYLKQFIASTSTMATPPAAGKHGKKLHGRAFYESLGSPKYVLAPMVDQSEFAWRMLTRSFLPADQSTRLLAYSPMLHSRLFAETPKYRNHHFEPLNTSIPSPEERSSNSKESKVSASEYRLDGNPAFDRPLFVQFCSNSEDDLLAAAKFVEPYCDAVDLNLGCPQGIARKGHYGAFLQEDWDLIYRLINNLHNQLSIPVTAKMRILETKEKTLDYAKMILSAGASIITVHGRRREQKGHNTGLADWDVLRYLRENLPPETVIFANGNILQHGDIEKCLAATGADGVMSAEGNLNDPTVFSEAPPVGKEGREYWRGRDGKGGYRMDAVLRRYLDILHKYVLQQDPPVRSPLFIPSDPHQPNEELSHDTQSNDEQPPAKKQKLSKGKKDAPINLRVVQAHLFNMLRPLVSKHTDIRDALARSRSGDIEAYERVLGMVERVTKQGLIDYEKEAEGENTAEESNGASENPELDPTVSSKAAVERCRRPWWICQPYIRPLPQEALEKGAMTISKKDKMKMNGSDSANEPGVAKDQQKVDLETLREVVPNASSNRELAENDGTQMNQREENQGRDQAPAAGVVCG